MVLVFALDSAFYGLRLAAVERVLPIVEITSLPGVPEFVLGAISLHGRIIPVISLRKRFGLNERDLQLQDQLIVTTTARRTMALVVDSTSDVVELPDDRITAARRIYPGVAYLEGVTPLSGGLTLIVDLEALLSIDDENALDIALREGVTKL